jgi:hypothetical protein
MADNRKPPTLKRCPNCRKVAGATRIWGTLIFYKGEYDG